MKTYNFEDALEIASKDLKSGFSKDEVYLLELMAQINGVEMIYYFRQNITYFLSNFCLGKDGVLEYTEDGIKSLRQTLIHDLDHSYDFEQNK